MATFLEGGVDMVPPALPFQPNYNLILNTLQYRQGQYDQGFAQVKNAAGSIINAQLTNETNLEKRKQILANAEAALKTLPTVDLSLPQNVSAANSVFKPFYDDNGILKDMALTKGQSSQMRYAMSLQQSDKEEDRKRFWSIGVQDMQDNMEALRTATPEQLAGMSVRRYVGRPQTGEKVLEMFNSGKLKREVDKITGQVKITDTNGKEVITPLTNLFLANAQADPEEMEAYNVYGRVRRNQYIRENEARLGSKEAAAAQHDSLLVKDYKANNTASLKETTDALDMVNARITKWKERGVENLTDEEAQRYASDMADARNLKQSQDYYNSADKTAENNILGNPSAYLGQVYMNKTARDLAKSLSAFGSRKIDTNPIYKDLVQPFKIEEFKTNEAMRQKEYEHKLKMEEIRYTAEMKDLYGDDDDGDGTSKDGSGGGKGSGKFKLNEPIVQDNPAGAGVKNRTPEGLPDAHADFIDSKRQVISRTVDAKINFIDNVLSARELVDENGDVLDQNKKQNLRNNGALLDALVKKAETKVNVMVDTKDPQRFAALSMKKRVEQNMNLWRAMDAYGQDIYSQIIGNFEGSSSDGWVYKHLMLPGKTLRKADDLAGFTASIKQDPSYKNALGNYILEAQNKLDRQASAYNVPSSRVDPARVEQEFLNKHVEKAFTESRAEFMKKFNTSNSGGGYSFTARYDPMASKGGGGINARQLQFVGKSSVAGEEADIITQDLLTKITGTEGSEDVVFAAGPDSSSSKAVDTKGGTDQDDDVKRLFNEVIKPNVLASVKAGKDAPLKYYTISSSQVASNNPNYHVYTLTFDPDYLAGITSTDSKPGIIEKADADKLGKGVSIYIKADKDNTLMAQRSSIGEIEMLLNSAKTDGVLEDKIAPGYDMRIEKMIQGGYKLITTYPVVSKENPLGKPVTRTTVVPQGADLTYMYYSTISRLTELYEQVETAADAMIKTSPDRKRYTQAEIDAMAEAMLQNR